MVRRRPAPGRGRRRCRASRRHARTLAADGLRQEPNLAVSRLGDGVVIHTQPDSGRRLPILLGYADARGQWYRDGRRRHETTEPAAPAAEPAAAQL